MSILTRGFPEAVCIDGKSYAVNTGFKVWIQFSEILDDPNMSLPEKAQKILLLCYPDQIPESFSKAVYGLLWFYGCGKTKQGHKNGMCGENKRIFSFAEDAALIYAAFWKECGIDLSKRGLALVAVLELIFCVE